jgi:type VI secretion system secreted protein Hcp
MAVDMFLKIGTLKGESKDKVKTDWIDVLAWNWGLTNSGTAHVGGGAGAGKVAVQDLSFTKYIDLSSTDLMTACCEGKHFDKATLIVRKAGGKPLEYVTIEMQEVMITGVSTGGSAGEDRLVENVILNFAKVKVDYAAQKADGTKGATPKMGWDVAANTKL